MSLLQYLLEPTKISSVSLSQSLILSFCTAGAAYLCMVGIHKPLCICWQSWHFSSDVSTCLALPQLVSLGVRVVHGKEAQFPRVVHGKEAQFPSTMQERLWKSSFEVENSSLWKQAVPLGGALLETWRSKDRTQTWNKLLTITDGHEFSHYKGLPWSLADCTGAVQFSIGFNCYITAKGLGSCSPNTLWPWLWHVAQFFNHLKGISPQELRLKEQLWSCIGFFMILVWPDASC